MEQGLDPEAEAERVETVSQTFRSRVAMVVCNSAHQSFAVVVRRRLGVCGQFILVMDNNY